MRSAIHALPDRLLPLDMDRKTKEHRDQPMALGHYHVVRPILPDNHRNEVGQPVVVHNSCDSGGDTAVRGSYQTEG